MRPAPSAMPRSTCWTRLGRAVAVPGQQVGVEPAVRRLVDVVPKKNANTISAVVQKLGMNATQREAEAHRAERDEHERAPAPSGVWKVSLQGPITSGRVSANRPSAASTSAISVVEFVNSPKSGGR